MFRSMDKMELSHKHGHCISCDEKLAVDQLEEMKVDKQMKDSVNCSPSRHAVFRSALEHLKWLQSRTQCHISQICCPCSRCALAAVNPAISDVRELNKTVRTLKMQYIDARFWPIKGPQRIVGWQTLVSKQHRQVQSKGSS